MARITSLEGAAEQSLSMALGFGIGMALGNALAPTATRLRQAAFEHEPTAALDPGTAAAIVAEQLKGTAWGEGEAAKHGMDAARFDALLAETLEAPAFGELVRMLRRQTIDSAGFEHGLRKAKMEDRYDTALAELQHDRLEPATLAVSIQRGIIADPGLLPVGPPTATGKVPPMPQAKVDAIAEARDAGIDRERLAALTRIVGLPPAPGELLELVNRGVIDTTDYLRGIAEGNTRNEWAPFLLELRRRLLTPEQYADARVRGWIGKPEQVAGAGMHGITPADAELLFNLNGRPIPVHQVTTGEARGGRFSAGEGGIPQAFLRSLQQGSLRPEWYSLAYANRHTLPSAFVIRSMMQGGELGHDDGHTLLLESGWPPELAAKAAAAFAGGTGKGAKNLTAAELLSELEGLFVTPAEFHSRMAELGYAAPAIADYQRLAEARRVKRARDARIARIRTAYTGHRSTLEQATAELEKVGLSAEAQALIVAEWEADRAANVAALTPAQVKKAYLRQMIDRLTALAELEQRGYTAGDAATLLDE